MPRLTTLNHLRLSAILRDGDYAIDLTAGNGYDTAFLLSRVGAQGIVFAFDLQAAAIEATARRCAGWGAQLRLIQGCHSQVGTVVPKEAQGWVGAVVANLGYLPGSNHEIISRAESSCGAVRDAFRLVRPGGAVSVLAYTGHPGGREEACEMRELFEAQRREEGWRVTVEGDEEIDSIRPVWCWAEREED